MATIKDKDLRNSLIGISQEEFLRMKERIRMADFRIRVFNTALKQERKAYDKLMKSQPKRMEVWHPKYDDIQKLNDEYIIGKMTNEEYVRERYAIWQVYSDRGHENNIKWLEGMLKHYQDARQGIEDELETRRKAGKRKKDRRRAYLKKHATHMRKVRRAKKKKELEERWKRHGIG